MWICGATASSVALSVACALVAGVRPSPAGPQVHSRLTRHTQAHGDRHHWQCLGKSAAPGVLAPCDCTEGRCLPGAMVGLVISVDLRRLAARMPPPALAPPMCWLDRPASNAAAAEPPATGVLAALSSPTARDSCSGECHAPWIRYQGLAVACGSGQAVCAVSGQAPMQLGRMGLAMQSHAHTHSKHDALVGCLGREACC